MSHTKNIFKILKTIDYCYKNQIPLNFDLKKLNIDQHMLGLYLHNLIVSDYIEGIIVSKQLNIPYYLKYEMHQYTHLTIKGMMFLEENSTMKKLYSNLKEIKDWLVLLT